MAEHRKDVPARRRAQDLAVLAWAPAGVSPWESRPEYAAFRRELERGLEVVLEGREPRVVVLASRAPELAELAVSFELPLQLARRWWPGTTTFGRRPAEMPVVIADGSEVELAPLLEGVKSLLRAEVDVDVSVFVRDGDECVSRLVAVTHERLLWRVIAPGEPLPSNGADYVLEATGPKAKGFGTNRRGVFFG